MTSAPANCFEIFGFEPDFSLDLDELESRYLSLSRQAHPDFHHFGTADDQRESLDRSAQLNRAYRTLADPLLRGEYLMELLGGPGPSTNREMPPDFLEEILELRSLIENAKTEQSRRAQQSLADRIGADRNRLIADLGRLFAAGAENRNLTEIRQVLNTVRYLDGLLRDLEE